MGGPKRQKICLCVICGKGINHGPIIYSKLRRSGRVLFAHPVCYDIETKKENAK